MRRLVALCLPLTMAACAQHAPRPMVNYCSQPAIGAAIVRTANQGAPTASPAIRFEGGTVRSSVYNDHVQVLACHGSLVRGNGTREDGVAIARLSHMHTDWKSLWSTTAATHQWLSDADIARNRQDRYANYYEHTPQACKPYAHDLFYGAPKSDKETDHLRETLYDCLAEHNVKPLRPVSGVEHTYSPFGLNFYIPYYTNLNADDNGPFLY
ncbi:hypothetical protein LV564_16150 [Komagataeibacter nataicola]|nr:hypothetical protein [Komagataeibacter nataicola]WEQ55576.1 hypothetical protein LV564_16150 [Komagataeibacter nataicola]WNM09553.1 hypothetical protein RI056_06335 [Komagataeibacter nataicola]GBR25393.1 hypothetical protein AA0616_2969 [Komagataeibacter nataicola NRIC 0616]